jgi:hypothetical protein
MCVTAALVRLIHQAACTIKSETLANKSTAVAAARAAATAHLGAHAIGAAAYPAKAAGLASPAERDAVIEEIRWELRRVSLTARAALRQLPPVGVSKAGRVRPGLLASGQLGAIVAELQARLAAPAD